MLIVWNHVIFFFYTAYFAKSVQYTVRERRFHWICSRREVRNTRWFANVICHNVTMYMYSQTCISDPVSNGHPLLSSQFLKSRNFLPLFTLNATSTERSPCTN